MRNIILICFLAIFSLSFAQDEYGNYEFSSLQNKKIGGNTNKLVNFKLSFLTPTVAAEFKMAPKFSFEVAGKMNVAVLSNSTFTQFLVLPFPVVHVEPKWNYNILKRESKGKKTENFSSNFISLYTSYRVKVSTYTRHSLLIGPTWGMQRTLGKIGYFKLNTGLGYFHIFDKATLGGQQNLPVMPILDVQLGLIF